MRLLTFVLVHLTAISHCVSQTISSIPVIGDGVVHSIVFDQPAEAFYFVVAVRKEEGETTIKQYSTSNDSLMSEFKFEDIVTHAYGTSNGFMYISLKNSESLLIYNFIKDEVIDSKNSLYSVHHANEDYLFVHKVYSLIATNEEYHKQTGMVVLNKQTLEEIPSTFLPGTFIYQPVGEYLLLKEIVRWGYADEYSRVQMYSIKDLKRVVSSLYEEDGILQNVSLSNNYLFYTVTNSREMLLFRIPDVSTYKEKISPEGWAFKKAQFTNDNVLLFLESNNSKLFLNRWDIHQADTEQLLVDSNTYSSGFEFGAISFVYNINNSKAIVFSRGSKNVYIIKY